MHHADAREATLRNADAHGRDKQQRPIRRLKFRPRIMDAYRGLSERAELRRRAIRAAIRRAVRRGRPAANRRASRRGERP